MTPSQEIAHEQHRRIKFEREESERVARDAFRKLEDENASLRAAVATLRKPIVAFIAQQDSHPPRGIGWYEFRGALSATSQYAEQETGT